MITVKRFEGERVDGQFVNHSLKFLGPNTNVEKLEDHNLFKNKLSEIEALGIINGVMTRKSRKECLILVKQNLQGLADSLLHSLKVHEV